MWSSRIRGSGTQSPLLSTSSIAARCEELEFGAGRVIASPRAPRSTRRQIAKRRRGREELGPGADRCARRRGGAKVAIERNEPRPSGSTDRRSIGRNVWYVPKSESLLRGLLLSFGHCQLSLPALLFVARGPSFF